MRTRQLVFILALMVFGGGYVSAKQYIDNLPSNSETSFYDSKAKALQVLKTVYQRYDALSSLTMDIDVTIMDGDYAYKKTGSTIVKGDKFKLDTEDEKIVSDGQSMWVYLKSDKSLQITDATEDNQNFFCYPTKLLQKYQSSCAVELIGQANGNYTVQFNAYNDDCPYETIKVSINKNYQITKISVLEAEDMGYTISINNIKKNVSLSDSTFKFNTASVDKSKTRDLRTK